MAKAFEDGGDAVEAVAAGIDQRQHRVEFVGDAFLFSQWSKWNFICFEYSLADVLLRPSLAERNQSILCIHYRVKQIPKRDDFCIRFAEGNRLIGCALDSSYS